MPAKRERETRPGTFVHRLNECWAASGLAAYEVAGALPDNLRGTGRNAIGAYLDGDRVPRLDVVEALASVLDVDPAWLAFGEDCDA